MIRSSGRGTSPRQVSGNHSRRDCLPYGSLPLDRFKITHDYPDPFVVKQGRGWRPFKTWLRGGDANAHRRYVGRSAGGEAPWEESCRFQLDFLKKRGLQPDDVFLDIGCGSLRGGLHFIAYLRPGRYLGSDISAEVVRRGIVHELGMAEFDRKRPEFVISDGFEFRPFSRAPTFVLASSVFTHLPPDHIALCLKNLRAFVGDRAVEFFATFTEVESHSRHAGPPHYFGGKQRLNYTRDEMHDLGRAAGWRTDYIGVWGHPKNTQTYDTKQQRLFRFATP